MLIGDSLGRPKKLLVFVNPFGGKKTARKIFQEEVKPLFEDANIQLEIQETKYQLHAKEIVRSMDVSKYDGIVCVSGDGILVEVSKKFSLCCGSIIFSMYILLDILIWK